MITPRVTRLWRTPDLKAFQRAVIHLLPSDPFDADASAVIVPSRGAAEELRRTIEDRSLENPGDVRVIPWLVTRDDLYVRLRERLPNAPNPLSAFEREVLLRRSAGAASQSGAEPPFNIRPGLIPAILELYDDLRRRHKSIPPLRQRASRSSRAAWSSQACSLASASPCFSSSKASKPI